MTESVQVIRDGKTEYRLVWPERATEKERYAAELLETYLGKCFGCVPARAGEEYGGAFLSVGETKKLERSGLARPAERSLDAANISVKEGEIYLYGDDEDGCINAVLEFLERFAGVRFFAPDETLCPVYRRLDVPVGTIRSVPDFETRMLGYFGTMSNRDFAYKKRVLYDHSNWGLWSHTHFLILPPEKYASEHRDWYSKDGTQLCLTNEEMRKEFTENLFRIIQQNPQAEYFMLGQEDEDTFCDCENCLRSHAENGGRAGTMMIFVNKVAEEIERRLKNSSTPSRKVLLVTFAYCKTEEPPVGYDAEKDKFFLKNSAVRARHNVGVMFAPIFTCFTHDMMNKTCNLKVRNNLLGWSEVSQKLLVWCYSSNYAGYLVPLNNFNTVLGTYRTFRDYGVVYIFNQGIFNSLDTFHYLKIYLHSALMWNVDADTERLKEEFFANYYRAAAPYMRKYYDEIRDNYAKQESEEHPFHCYCLWNTGSKIFTGEVFSREFLERCQEYLNGALHAVLTGEDDELLEKLRIRVLRENLFIKYMWLELYHEDFSRLELQKRIFEFEWMAKITDVTRFKTGGGVRVGGPEMKVKIEEWKKKYLAGGDEYV